MSSTAAQFYARRDPDRRDTDWIGDLDGMVDHIDETPSSPCHADSLPGDSEAADVRARRQFDLDPFF